MIAILYTTILTGSDDRERSRGSGFHGADEDAHDFVHLATSLLMPCHQYDL